MTHLHSHSKRLVASAFCLLLLLTTLPFAFGSDAWTDTEMLSDGTGHSHDPRIGIGPDGIVHTVWRDGSGKIMYRNLTDGVWSSASQVATGFYPNIAVGPDNVLHLVYASSGKVYLTSFNGSWSSPEGVFTNTTESRYPVVDIGPDGTIHVICWETIDQDHHLRYRNKTTVWNTEAWVGVFTSDFSTYSPYSWDMVASANGDAHIVFTKSLYTSTQVEYISLEGGVWSSSAVVSAGSWARYPSIVQGSDGALHLLYKDDAPIAGGEDIFNLVYRCLDEGSWSDPELVSVGSVEDTNVGKIAIADDGRLHAVWSQDGGASYSFRDILLHNMRGDGGWGSSTVIPTGVSVNIVLMNTAVAPNGSLHVMWPAYVGSYNEINHNSLLLQAIAGADISVDEGGTASFNATGTFSARGVQTYNWTFAYDNAWQTMSGATPTFQFLIPGTYSVTLNVTDTDGNWDEDTMTVTVNDTTPPNADAGPDQYVPAGSWVVFDGSASTDNVEVTSYSWNFTYNSSPQTLSGETPMFWFDTPGVYIVTLNVTDAKGKWDVDTMTLTINDTTAPNANAGVNQNVDEGSMVTFNGAASTDNVAVVNYTWTFTYDGGLVTRYGVTPSFQFDIAGSYVVTLNVTDVAGNWAIDTMTVTVNDTTAPNANAGSNQTVNSGVTVTLNGSASTDNVGLTAYNWTFTYNGSVQSLAGVSPSFNFVTPGVYQVTLNVSDAAGNWDTDTMTVTVNTSLSIGPVTAGGTILVGANITVTFGELEFQAVTDENGNATVVLPPGAIGESLTVTIEAAGHSTKSTTLVLAGIDEQLPVSMDLADDVTSSDPLWIILVLVVVAVVAVVAYRRLKD